MTKTLAVLTHDLAARAGQLLVLLDSGVVIAVDIDREVLREEPAAPTPPPVETPVPAVRQPRTRAARRAEALGVMRNLLLRGRSVAQVARTTGLSRNTINRHYDIMAADGLLPSRFEAHRYFKTPEQARRAQEHGTRRAALMHGKRQEVGSG